MSSHRWPTDVGHQGICTFSLGSGLTLFINSTFLAPASTSSTAGIEAMLRSSTPAHEAAPRYNCRSTAVYLLVAIFIIQTTTCRLVASLKNLTLLVQSSCRILYFLSREQSPRRWSTISNKYNVTCRNIQNATSRIATPVP